MKTSIVNRDLTDSPEDAGIRKKASEQLAGDLIFYATNYDPGYDENEFDKNLARAEKQIKDALLWKAYASLPTQQKRIIKQLVFSKTPPIEVAKRFGISLNTVYAHKKKALANLRKRLGIKQKFSYRTVKN